MAKNFKINTNPVYNTIEEATTEPVQADPNGRPRKTYTATMLQEFAETGTTQGHKGAKAKRINMAFTPENYDYIKTMARVTGSTCTDVVNTILAKHIQDNREIYDQAVAFRDSL